MFPGKYRTVLIYVLTGMLASTVHLTARAEQRSPALKVCYENWSPYAFLDESDTHTGYSVELVNEIFLHLNRTLSYSPMSYDECVRKVSDSEMDMILMGNDFPRGILQSEGEVGHWMIAAIVRKNAPLRHFHDMTDFQGMKWARTIGYEFPPIINSYEGFADVYELDDSADILLMLQNAYIDVYFEDYVWAQSQIEQKGYKLRVLHPPISIVPQYAGFNKNLTSLANDYSARLMQLHQDGSVDRLYQKYFGIDYETFQNNLLPKLTK